jgi:hypothetical protein
MGLTEVACEMKVGFVDAAACQYTAQHSADHPPSSSI